MFNADGAPAQGRCVARGGLEKFRTPRRSAKARPKKKSARKKLYALHAWLGFHLALIMAAVLFTGTVAMVSNEIDWLIQHDMRVVPDGEKVSWGEMEAAVRAYAPGEPMPFLYSMGGDHFAYRAWVYDAYGAHRFVHVNQWTGEVTGETHPLTVQRFFRDLHRYLFLPSSIGLPLVTSLAFILAVSLYTGLKTTRNWKTVMFRIRMKKGSRILIGDAHKAAGIWGSWFIVVMIVTGAWYLIEYGAFRTGAVLGDVERYEFPARLSEARVAEFGPVIKDRPLDDVIKAAGDAYPGLHITAVYYPIPHRGAYKIMGTFGNPLVGEGANAVYIDPVSLEALKVHKWKDFSTFFALNEMADPLHFGGLPTNTNRFRPLAGVSQSRFEIEPAVLDGLNKLSFTFAYYDGSQEMRSWDFTDAAP